MNGEMFFYLRDLGLIVYACLKAFLPLPSLEVILIPLIVSSPEHWILYSLEGALGTCIGGAIGYGIARKAGSRILNQFASEKEIEASRKVMDKYGVLAVFIGGVTPIPDFLLAYLAGLCRMNFLAFTLSDGAARLLRSLLVGYCIRTLNLILDIERWGTVFSLAIVAWLLLKWAFKREEKAIS